MKNLRVYELPCIDNHKSFYGKAHVIEHDDAIYLMSYETYVARIVDGKFERLWNGYSRTTERHIKSFMKLFHVTE